MANAAELVIKIVTDASNATAGITQTASKMDRLASGARKALPAAAAVAGGLVLVGTKAVQSASELEQAQGAVESIYGKSAKAVDDYAQTSVDRLGLSEAAYKNYSALVGAALQNAGFSAQQAAGMSDKAMVRAADMASTFGGTTSEAVDAINAAVSRAEFDPLEKYGVSLNKTAISAELAKRGQDDLTGAALKQAEAQATLDLIYQKTGKSAGQFARESDTVAGQQQRAAAAFENAAATIGTALLPVIASLAQKLAQVATWIGNNSKLVLTLAGVLGGLAAAVFAVNAALALYKATMTVVTVVTKLFGVAAKSTWRAVLGPIGLVVAAIGVVIAIVMVLWNKFPPFRNAVIAVWRAIANVAKATWRGIKQVVSSVIGWAKGFIKGFGNVVKAVWRAIAAAGKAAWRGIKSVVSTVIGVLKTIIKAYATVAKAVFRAIKTVATAAWRGIKTVISGVVNAIKGIVRGLKTAVNGVWNAIKSTATTVWNAIKNVVSTTVNSIKNILNGIKNAASNVWDSVKNGATNAFNAILTPVNAVKNAIQNVIDAVKSLIDKIKGIKFPKIPDLNPFSAPAPAPPPAPSFYAAARAPRAAPTLAGSLAGLGATINASSPVIINVTGTLHDADAARAVRRVLRNDQRRRGGVTIERRRQTALG